LNIAGFVKLKLQLQATGDMPGCNADYIIHTVPLGYN
jgi:hypothetical protein